MNRWSPTVDFSEVQLDTEMAAVLFKPSFHKFQDILENQITQHPGRLGEKQVSGCSGVAPTLPTSSHSRVSPPSAWRAPPAPWGHVTHQRGSTAHVRDCLQNFGLHTSWIYDLERVIQPKWHASIFVMGRKASHCHLSNGY